MRANPNVNDKLSRLKKRNYIVGDSDDIVHMDWSKEWTELKNLEPLPHGRGSETGRGSKSRQKKHG